MKTSIALVGFMGTGKTTVGKMLARKLVKEFIELDAEIEKKAGKTISDIFRESGEEYFRQLEAETLKEIAGRKNFVIACGGGVVLKPENIFRLKQECVIVCLSAAPDVILQRVSGDRNIRPLLDVDGREKRIKELLEYRRPLYTRAADIAIDTSGIDAPGVLKKILNALGKYESFDK
jgi:shikimate kinase